jgi:hypothetical protein
MSTIVSLRIETWDDKFVVVGEFKGYSEIPRREFDSYTEALKELAKVAQREELRHEAGIDRRSNW